MNKPRCFMCGRDVNANEHFFIIRQHTLCRSCGKQYKGKAVSINLRSGDENIGNNNRISGDDRNNHTNKILEEHVN